MKNLNKITLEKFALGIIGILFLISFISAYGVSSDYSNENHANIGPGETKVIDLLRILNGDTTPVNVRIELINGSGVASYTGDKEIKVNPSQSINLPIKITIPQDVPEDTKYDLVFKFTDITPSSEEGMISFSKASTVTMPIYVKKTQAQVAAEPVIEKPSTDYTIYLIIAVIVIIIAIVAYFLLIKKKK